jgi:hypothetical protein
VVFYDRTADPADFLDYVTYVALTPAGPGLGVTRLVKPITPAVTSNGLDGSLETGQATPGCDAFIGDYIGIASTNHDVFLGWTDNGPSTTTDPSGDPVDCDVNEDAFAGHLTY